MRESRKKATSTTKASRVIKNPKKVITNNVTQSPNAQDFLQLPQGWLKYFAYILSIVPPCGFLFGILFYSQPTEEAKQFGRNCIILGGLGLIGICFCWGIAGLMRGLMNNTPSGGLVGGYY